MSTNKTLIITSLVLGSALFILNATPSTPMEDMTPREVEALLRDRARGIAPEEIRPLADHLIRVAHANNFAASSILSVIMTESGFRNSAESSVGALGLMQLMPETAQFVASKAGITDYQIPSDLRDPFVNITVGVTYLSMLRERFGQTHLYLAAYNMGPTKFRRLMQSPESIRRLENSPVDQYVHKIRSGVYPISFEGARLALADTQ